MSLSIKNISKLLLLILGSTLISCHTPSGTRQDILLNSHWVTTANDTNIMAYEGFEKNDFNTTNWLAVNIPHNWDDYGGYRRMMHGNRHGYAWYRKSFVVQKEELNKRYFLFFEGVGSYASVWLNGQKVGYHAGGRTTFTLDITEAIALGEENILAVRADHPDQIRDLPWVCGGCSSEWGFSEGSQPMGIFRPVHLIVTNNVRVEPFGVHVWNDHTITTKKATLNINTEVKNYSQQTKHLTLVQNLKNAKGKVVASTSRNINIKAAQIDTISQNLNSIKNPQLWSTTNPYLYTLETHIIDNGKIIDLVNTTYGIRTIKWDIKGEQATNQFYINDQPLFINGTAEYEHILGQSHAFSDQQIDARVEQIMAMGYNSFRDAHQPHNFRYHQAWDKHGMLWWTQMAAHIWFDTPEFRANFKTLLHDWVKERRNSPSVILWGLENESTLPHDFTVECTELIRSLDPTTSSQRLVTTCNGGSGTDWNVIQNWSGTYGGNPEIYDEEISKQLLNGEYGAWRSIDLHTEGEFDAKGALSEDRMCLLMESKIRLAEKTKNNCCGQYHWLFNSHDNPGRTQSGEGLRDIDRLGPINYKGAVTIWGEPLDLFYMFRSNYVDSKTNPMLYIVSHTWPDRWTTPGIKDGIRIFSNCDEVELFNSLDQQVGQRQKRQGIGTHFVFDNINVQSNVLHAKGYVNGKAVAKDLILLHHLPEDEKINTLQGNVAPLQEKDNNWHALYKVNCGGDNYTDTEGELWMADVHLENTDKWGSTSWTDKYSGLPAFYGSQRQTNDPIQGSKDWELMQRFRYGRHQLKYHFPVPDGTYKIDMFFVEPWYGTGGGLDCQGWRLFDIAINNEVKIKNLDIWQEAGHDQLVRKTVIADISEGAIDISFPETKSGQAIISAIAIYTQDTAKPAHPSSRIITKLLTNSTTKISNRTWMDTNIKPFNDSQERISYLPPVLYGGEWIQHNKGQETTHFTLSQEADVYIGIDTSYATPPWLNLFLPSDKHITTVGQNKTSYVLYQKRFEAGEIVHLSYTKQSAYIVAAVATTQLDKAIDLRKTTTYQAEKGKKWGQAKQVQFMKKDCIKVPNHKGSIGFVFQVGLASKYGLQFRYMNMAKHEIEADVEIRANDGRLMWSGQWTFPAANIKWKSFRTDTQTTINAGTYTLKITPHSTEPLYFDWVKVQ